MSDVELSACCGAKNVQGTYGAMDPPGCLFYYPMCSKCREYIMPDEECSTHQASTNPGSPPC